MAYDIFSIYLSQIDFKLVLELREPINSVKILIYLEVRLFIFPFKNLSCFDAESLLCISENGMLHILDRNMRIKPKPEKFQESKNTYDLILTCEEKVYDQVMESFESAGSTSAHLAHIINIDVIDNPEDATLGAFVMLKLVQKLDSCEDLDDEIDEILQEFESTTNRAFLHTVAFY